MPLRNSFLLSKRNCIEEAGRGRPLASWEAPITMMRMRSGLCKTLRLLVGWSLSGMLQENGATRRIRWIAGVDLLVLASAWGNYPLDSCPDRPLTAPQCPFGSPAVVSWGELPICAAWLVLGAVMTWILAVPARRSDVPGTSSRASGGGYHGCQVPFAGDEGG
jgi:hypothetical protein